MISCACFNHDLFCHPNLGNSVLWPHAEIPNRLTLSFRITAGDVVVSHAFCIWAYHLVSNHPLSDQRFQTLDEKETPSLSFRYLPGGLLECKGG